MKYIQLIFLILIFVTNQNIWAQRIGKEAFKFTYIQLPYSPLPENIKTYSAEIDAGGINFKGIHLVKPLAYIETGSKNNYGSVEQCEIDFLDLPGYSRISENADLHIGVKLTRLSAVNKIMKSGKGIFIENKERVERKIYYYEFSYSFSAEAGIFYKNGDTLWHEVLMNTVNKPARFGFVSDDQVSGGPRQNFGASYTTPDELENYFQQRFLLDQEIEWTREQLFKVKNRLFNEYGKPLVFQKMDFITGKGRKADYSDLDTALVKVARFIELFQKTGEENNAALEMKSAIELWENALKEADLSDKKARINEEIASGLNYNIGLANVCLANFDACEEYFEKASTTKDGQKLVRDVVAWAKDYEKRIKINTPD